MVDRRLVTDIGLALLIALPAILPAAPNPWSANDAVGKPSEISRSAEPGSSLQRQLAATAPRSEIRS